MINVADIALTSLETITCFAIDGDYLFTLDELQNANISQTEEKVDITGKQGRKLTSLKRNKAVTVTGDNGMVSAGLWERQTGNSFESGTMKVRWTDYLTVDASNAATLTYKAQGDAGQEIIGLFIEDSNGLLSTELTQDSTVATGKFTYDTSTKKIQCHTDVPSGTKLVAFYDRNVAAKQLVNKSDEYSEKCQMYIDAIGEDRCGNAYHVQIYIPKADFSGEYSFDMGDNQTIHSFSADALAGSCGNSGEFFTYTIFSQSAGEPTT